MIGMMGNITMIDFDKGLKITNKFLGSEKKITMLYNGEIYMLKFPDPSRSEKNDLSYMNNQFSEHIGCRIFKDCGFVTQETFLGTYTDITGKNKTVVGCKDFTQDGSVLYECSKLANSVESVDEKVYATMENVRVIIDETTAVNNKEEIMAQFWNMFVVDALLGNRDRHLENWGLLFRNGDFAFAPIYDCGSTLGAFLSDDAMRDNMRNETRFNNVEYNVNSCYSLGEKKIFYHEIFKTPPDELNDAIRRIIPKIDMERIKGIVLSTEGISEVRREYLIKSLTMRYERILAPALKRTRERERANESPQTRKPASTEKPGILGEGGTLAAAKAESERLNGERGKGKNDPER
jgi:hypothetical protein